MNLHDQLGALELGLDELILATTSGPASASSSGAPASSSAASASPAPSPASEPASEAALETPPLAEEPLKLLVSRPQQNVIQMTIDGKSVALSAEGVSELIEQLSNARASMTVEQPHALPAGWQYVSTKNPAMATQRFANGDRLLVARHTGHGWVPFTFSPDVVIQMYMMLTQA
jgi:hypothetical protein